MSRTEKFWDVKLKLVVWIPKVKVTKEVFTQRDGKSRYALIGRTIDGRKLTKFVDRAYWETL